MGPTAHVVLTKTAKGRARRALTRRLEAAARTNGWQLVELSPAELDAGGHEIERLVVCGGDGLIHRCLPHVAGTECQLAIVPVGTGNDFARAFDLGDDEAVARALSTSTASKVWSVDLLRSRSDPDSVATALRRPQWAASVVTGGFSGRVTETANGLRFPPGSAKYTVAALLEMVRLSATPTRLVVSGGPDGETVIEGDLAMFAIANTAWFGGGMKVCPDADPADGLLEVLVVDDVSRVAFARWLPRAFRGTHTTHPAVRTARGTSVRIETDEHLWADGEPFCDPPVTIDAEPGSLRLLVP